MGEAVSQTILSGDINNSPGTPGDDSQHVVSADATVQRGVCLDGFTVQNGFADGAGSSRQGGGIINFGDFVLANCILRDNHASAGAGVANFGELRVEDCHFEGNHVYNRTLTGGGGVYSDPLSTLVLIRSTFTKNTVAGASQRGAGLYVNSSVAQIVNCCFYGNMAEGYGGGIYSLGSNSTIANCTFTGNTALAGGGVLFTGGAPNLINCSLAANVASFSGGGIYVSPSTVPNVTNCILWNNVDPSDPPTTSEISLAGTASVFVRYSCVRGASPYPGNGNINADPQFVRDPDDGGDGWCYWEFEPNDDFGDLRLRSLSPSIDAASNIDLPLDAADLDGDRDLAEFLPFDRDGNPRRADNPGPDPGLGRAPLVDMGAYERPADAVCQFDFGYGGPAGVTLTVCGGDLTQPGQTASVSLSGARPNSPAFLFIGMNSNPTPFPAFVPAGTLVPHPWVRILQRTTDAAGEVTFFNPTSQGPNLRTFYLQAIVADLDSLQFSNAVRLQLLRP